MTRRGNVRTLVGLNAAFDRAPDNAARKAFKRAKAVEERFARQLRKVARAVHDLIDGFDMTRADSAELVRIQLEQYASLLDPWARSAAERMIAEVNARDWKAWKEVSARIGRNLRHEIDDTAAGRAMRALLQEQTSLITSIPREAADRVRKVTLQGIVEGKRPAAYVAQIMETGGVTKNRATLIARTEVARTQSVLTQARAQSIGCTHFIWRSMKDSDVRASHRALNGKAFAYADPPLSDPPDHYSLPGQIWNCFPAETEIALGCGIRAIYRAPFKGKVIDIVASGSTVTATENHPVLTSRGWVAAGELKKGDYLVYAVNDAKLIVDANEDHRKPTFGELFEAFGSAKHKAPAGRKFNFHGDTPDGEVDEILFDDPLTDDHVAQICQRVRDGSLADPDRRVVSAAVSCIDQVLEPSGPRLPDELAALAVRHAPHPENVRVAPAADQNAGSNEDAADYVAGNLEPQCKRQLTVAFDVSSKDFGFVEIDPTVRRWSATALDSDADCAKLETKDVRIDADGERRGFECGAVRYQFLRVIDLRVRDFAGHVFTLETTKGIYGVGSASAIVKNCRCFAEPIIPDDL